MGVPASCKVVARRSFFRFRYLAMQEQLGFFPDENVGKTVIA
jgi:hypothetical protein